MESPSALAAFQAIRSAHGKALPQVEVVWDGVSVTGSKPAGRCASKPAPLLEDVHAKARPGRLTIVRTCTAVSHHAATGPREPVSFPWRESRGHCLLELRVARGSVAEREFLRSHPLARPSNAGSTGSERADWYAHL